MQSARKTWRTGLLAIALPEEFGRFIRSEIVKWSKIAKDVGAKAE
jgi:hypothetical protein